MTDALFGIRLFAGMKGRINYLTDRQNVIAQNIANANTPYFRVNDLKPVDFSQMVKQSAQGVQLAVTNERHLQGNSRFFSDFKVQRDREATEVTPMGNNVNLEDQTFKMTETAEDHQTVTQIYRQFSAMLKRAAGGNGQG